MSCQLLIERRSWTWSEQSGHQHLTAVGTSSPVKRWICHLLTPFGSLKKKTKKKRSHWHLTEKEGPSLFVQSTSRISNSSTNSAEVHSGLKAAHLILWMLRCCCSIVPAIHSSAACKPKLLPGSLSLSLCSLHALHHPSSLHLSWTTAGGWSFVSVTNCLCYRPCIPPYWTVFYQPSLSLTGLDEQKGSNQARSQSV